MFSKLNRNPAGQLKELRGPESMRRVQRALHESLEIYHGHEPNKQDELRQVLPQLMEGRNGVQIWRMLRVAPTINAIFNNMKGQPEQEIRRSLEQALPALRNQPELSLKNLESAFAFISNVEPKVNSLKYSEFVKLAEGMSQGLYLSKGGPPSERGEMRGVVRETVLNPRQKLPE